MEETVYERQKQFKNIRLKFRHFMCIKYLNINTSIYFHSEPKWVLKLFDETLNNTIFFSLPYGKCKDAQLRFYAPFALNICVFRVYK